MKQAVRSEIALAEQRGSIGNAALPRSAKRYFTDNTSYKVNAFQACETYLRKLSRKDGNVFERRYFYVGSRHGVRIYEPFNIQTNAQATHIFQRLIWQEYINSTFIATRRNFALLLTDHAQYVEAIS